MIRATIDLPKQWGPLKGLPRNPKPLLRLLDETSLPEDYRQVGTLDARADSARSQTPVVLIYQEQSAFIDTFDYLEAHLPDAHPVLMPRPNGATSARSSNPSSSPSTSTRACRKPVGASCSFGATPAFGGFAVFETREDRRWRPRGGGSFEQRCDG